MDRPEDRKRCAAAAAAGVSTPAAIYASKETTDLHPRAATEAII